MSIIYDVELNTIHYVQTNICICCTALLWKTILRSFWPNSIPLWAISNPPSKSPFPVQIEFCTVLCIVGALLSFLPLIPFYNFVPIPLYYRPSFLSFLHMQMIIVVGPLSIAIWTGLSLPLFYCTVLYPTIFVTGFYPLHPPSPFSPMLMSYFPLFLSLSIPRERKERERKKSSHKSFPLSLVWPSDIIFPHF